MNTKRRCFGFSFNSSSSIRAARHRTSRFVMAVALVVAGVVCGSHNRAPATTINSGTLQLSQPVTTAPSSITGLVVQLDANDITGSGNPADGTQISTWTNLASGSPVGNLTGASHPYLNWTGNLMNGQPVVHFWGGSLTNSYNFGNDVTVLYVGRMDGGANARLLDSTANNWLLGYWGGAMNQVHWNSAGVTGTPTADFNSHMFMATADGANALGFGSVANTYNIDGTAALFDGPRALGGTTQGPNGLRVGGGGEPSYADIGEVLVFNRALNATERLQMQQYLQGKWYGQLPSTEAVDITASGATLDLNGVNQTIGQLTGVDGSHVLLNGGFLTIGQNNVSTTYSGDVANGSVSGGGLSKVGTGTLTLTGSSASSFTGPTQISRGFMALSKSANVTALGGDILMLNSLSPTMWMTADNQLSSSGVLSFVSEVNSLIGNARFNLTGTTQTLAGIVETDALRGGVIQNSESAFGGPSNSGTSTLVLAGSGNYSFNGYLRNATGVLGVSKTGSGTQTLVGDRITYTGATNVTDGTLKLTDTSAFVSSIANSSIVEFNAATTTVNVGSGVTLSGAGTWNKTGPGLLRLHGNAPALVVAATGQFNIQQGTLQNDNNVVNWSGNTADMDISAGAILDLFADAIFVDQLTGSGFVQNNYGNASGQSGASAFFEKLVVGGAGGSSTFSGVIRNNATSAALGAGVGKGGVELEKVGAGTLTLGGTNTYTGITTISGGTLQIGGAGQLGSGNYGGAIVNTATLQYSSSAAQTLSGAISGAGGTLIKDTSTSVLTLTGANSYTGATIVNAGTLSVGNGGTAGSISSSSAVSVAGGATVKWHNNNTTAGLTIANAISGSGTVLLQGTNVVGPSQLSVYTMSGDNSGFAGTWDINRSIMWANTSQSQLGASSAIDVQDRGTVAFNGGTFANNITVETGAGWHHNVGGGDVVLGAIRLEGTNVVNGNIVLNQSTGITNGDGTGANSTVGGYGLGNHTFNGVISGTGEFSMSRFTAWNGGTATDADIILGGASSNTYTGKTVVDGQHARADLWLSKTGGAVAINGGTTVQMGSNTGGQANLRMGGNEQFGTNDGGVLMNFVNPSGQWMRFDLKGTTQTLAGLNAGTVSTQAGAVIQNQGIDVVVPAGDATLTLNGSGTYLYNGYIRDQDNGGTARKLNLVKEGAGTQTLSGAQITYSGSTTVNGGIMTIAGTGIPNTPTVTIGSGALLNLSGPGNNQLSSGAASPTWDISGTLRVTTGTAHTLYATTITLNGGTMDSTGGTVGGPGGGLSGQYGAFFAGASRTITANGTGNTISGNGSFGINSGATLTLNTPLATDALNASVTFGVGASGTAGSLAKTGVGTATLSGVNTYTGITTVNQGTLLVNGTNSGGGFVIVNSGATLGGNGEISNGSLVTVDNGGTIAPGTSAGTLTMSNLQMINGSTYEYEPFDLIAVSDTLTLYNNWTLRIDNTSPGLKDGGSLVLFTFDTLTGGADLNPTFDTSLLGFSPSGPLSLSVSGSSILLNGISLVPEPTTSVLAWLGLWSLGFVGWRRRRRA